jgi:hypothetical protein
LTLELYIIKELECTLTMFQIVLPLTFIFIEVFRAIPIRALIIVQL